MQITSVSENKTVITLYLRLKNDQYQNMDYVTGQLKFTSRLTLTIPATFNLYHPHTKQLQYYVSMQSDSRKNQKRKRRERIPILLSTVSRSD